MGELGTAIEELEVAHEELRIQTEELSSARAMLDAERTRYRELFADAPESSLQVEREADRLRLAGVADFSTAPVLRDALQGLDPAASTVLDLAGLEFLDARCVQELVGAAGRLEPGAHLVLTGANRGVARVLELLDAGSHARIRLA